MCKKIIGLIILGVCFSRVICGAQTKDWIAKITLASGIVSFQRADIATWSAAQIGLLLYNNDKLKTEGKSRAEMTLVDGSILRIKEKTLIEIKDVREDSTAKKKGSKFQLLFGKLWARVMKVAPDSTFEIITPTAVVGVRGTEFSINVDPALGTKVSVFEGSVEVRTEVKEEVKSILLGRGQTIEVGPDRILTVPKSLEEDDRQEWKQWNLHSKTDYKNEMAMTLQADCRQSGNLNEIRNADYQLGKSLIDINGNRVRMEEYLFRPQTNQLQFYVISKRENRTDQAYELMTFNQNLPSNFSAAVREAIKGQWVQVTKPNWYLLKVEDYFANDKNDYAKWLCEDGDALWDMSGFYYQNFVKMSHIINGTTKWWTTDSGANYSWVGGGSPAPNLPTTTTNDPIYMKDTSLTNYDDGTWDRWTRYAIDDKGNLLKRSEVGTTFRLLTKQNMEVKIEASEFKGDIDVVLCPQILYNANVVK
ncbi:hypothetical protein COY51_01310 [Candidatus Desantisbacteria bacterium CG_4_10_14_0_8_um_filter_39_17]|uniref:FecR protein domain-containing protein n=1 Tax=Candidatus Desantisbacteria bacterium CG_4_10_14_0_8_um_filter_39_17 TaxID=1974542 RepID=A0A2H9PCM1_9BACT|nr:MAG: hypothetical protein COY51_01310 [Candidatus Desantisbacteria bacterium CG_4_10_14_0_8_um_filter_39_17]